MRLYQQLDDALQPEQYRKLLALIASKSACGHSLPSAQCVYLLNMIQNSEWYADRLTADELAVLLRPVLVGLLREGQVFHQNRWLTTPPIAQEAMARARAHIGGEAGYDLETFLEKLFNLSQQNGQPRQSGQEHPVQHPPEAGPQPFLGMPTSISGKRAALVSWVAALSTIMTVLLFALLLLVA